MPKSGNFSPAFLGSLTPATTLYEEGFCDRIICQKINSILGNPENRLELIHQLILNDAEITFLLQSYPSYFYNHFCTLIYKNAK